MKRLASLVALSAVALGLVPRSADADPVARTSEVRRPERRRNASWSHSNVWDYALAAAGTTALAVYFPLFQPERPPLRWSGPILFDTPVRDALQLRGSGARDSLEYPAWILWGMQLAYPVLVDVPLAWARHDPQLARDLFWQDAATLTIAAAIDVGLRDLVGRARPRFYDCLAQGGGSSCPGNAEATRSFPGGHMVNSTAASVLTCTQHAYMHLYDGPGDAVVCAMTLASDITIGVLRVMSDDHWVSDQLAGAAIGALVGWGIPYMLHFHRRSSPTDAGIHDTPRMIALPIAMPVDHGAAFGLVGLF